MDKQLKKNVVSMAASAALLLSVVYSGSAFAGPGNDSGKGWKNGPKGSISLFSVCYLEDAYPANAMIRVETTITDASSVPGDAELMDMTVQAQQKFKGRERFDIGDGAQADPVLENGVAEVSTTLPLCSSASGAPTLDPAAKSVNAEITVWITDEHNNKEDGFIARCSDDPDTLYVDEVAELNVWKQDLCQ